MDNYSYNTAYADGPRTPGRASTIQLGNARRSYNAAGAGAAAANAYGAPMRPAGSTQSAVGVRRGGHQAANQPSGARVAVPRAFAPRPSVQAQRPSHAAKPQRKSRRASNFMRYANDNRVVNAIYGFVTGSTKPLFILMVVIAVGVSLYFPVRDLYVAKRSSDILAQQVEIRKSYNDALQKDVDKLLSEDGIKDVATDKLGLVMPGEKKIDVVGLDDDSSSSSTDSSQAKKASEVEKEEQKVAEEAPWYIKALDTVFGFTGVEGQTVASSGN